MVCYFLCLHPAVVLLAVAGFGRCCKGLLRVRGSAPAFVFFNILFVWGVYIAVIRKVISPLMDIAFHVELVVLVIGLHSILSSNPGFVSSGSSCLDKLVNSPVSDVEAHPEELEPSTCGTRCEFLAEGISASIQRVRHCRHCKAYVKGFDHHCPAFGNCIGQENHVLFIFLLVGFIISEASYVACSSQFASKSHILDGTRLETSLSGNLAISTMLFSLLQVLWQGVFLIWHIYCICFNIRTDEWINWKRYPELQQLVQPQPGETITEMRFINPYDKGVLRNVKEFLKLH
ncbi:hypothetical protein F0562_021926 [Nyssa sinensis]|uniref:S-acyltransferase n=1 Tax=Nyssa sinensis TaxID=561372 RepID=A0A5J5BQ38_9ASTE|nr:hypothetical protein F0562_021926 [Nyssa sinensis]